MHGGKLLGRLSQIGVVLGKHRIDFLSRVTGFAHHHAQAIKEEVRQSFGSVRHALDLRFDCKGDCHKFVELHREVLFDQHAQHAQSVTAQCERILVAGGHLTDAEHTGQGFKLVGNGKSRRYGAIGEHIARKARQVVLRNSLRHFFGFAVVTGIVFAHDALQFGEFAHHQSAKISLGKFRGAFGLDGVSTDLFGHGVRNGLDAQHAFALAAELVVVHDVRKARNAAFERRLAVLLIEEFSISQTSAHHASVAGDDFLAAVGRMNVRNQTEAVHELALSVTHREVLLIGLHRQNQAFFRNSQELFFEFGNVNHRPFGKRIGLINQIFGRDERAAGFFCGFVQQFDEHFAACGIVGHHVALFAHRLFVGVGRSDVDFACAFKAVAHRGATGLKTKHFNVHDVFAIERHQMLDGTHELNRRHTVGELIVHHLRDRQSLDGVFKGLLQGVLDGHTGTNARIHQLFVLAVVDALKFRDVRRDAQRRHLLCQSGRGLAFGVQPHAHRHETLFKFLIRALFEYFRD